MREKEEREGEERKVKNKKEVCGIANALPYSHYCLVF